MIVGGGAFDAPCGTGAPMFDSCGEYLTAVIRDVVGTVPYKYNIAETKNLPSRNLDGRFLLLVRNSMRRDFVIFSKITKSTTPLGSALLNRNKIFLLRSSIR
jgi:hypothetical protein